MKYLEPNDKVIKIYTDGACSGNPGPGGFAAVLCENEGLLIVSGGAKKTTNNRMELLATVMGIKNAIERGYKRIIILSDSAYVINGVQKNWIRVWSLNNWKTSGGSMVKNRDYWEKLQRYLNDENLTFEFIKVKGHNGDALNELADKMARKQVGKYK